VAALIADLVAQRLVMDTQLAGDLDHGPIRGQDQLGRLTAELQRVLRSSPQRGLLPANRDSGSLSGVHETGARPLDAEIDSFLHRINARVDVDEKA
jgi:hypothetical protein